MAWVKFFHLVLFFALAKQTLNAHFLSRKTENFANSIGDPKVKSSTGTELRAALQVVLFLYLRSLLEHHLVSLNEVNSLARRCYLGGHLAWNL